MPFGFPGMNKPEGLWPGTDGSGSTPSLRTEPTCHSCGAIFPPLACTASTTFFHPARDASP